jgi:hypothetical protein
LDERWWSRFYKPKIKLVPEEEEEEEEDVCRGVRCYF